MYVKSDFDLFEAQEKLQGLKEQYKFSEDLTLQEVNDTLEKILFSMQVYEEAPKYVLTRSLYPDGVKLKSARFVIRPSVKYVLKVHKLKKIFTINAGSNFFRDFIQNILEWFDEYSYNKKLEHNVDRLNEVFADIVVDNDIPFTVEASLGEGFVDISDTHVVLGLSEGVIMGLKTLPLFDNNVQFRHDAYKEKIIETFKGCNRPYDIIKIKNRVTEDLDIYSRRAPVKLIRQIVNRKAKFVRAGTGYIEQGNTFAVVDKVATTSEKAAKVDEDSGILVVDNVNMTTLESQRGLDKIVMRYRISPFNTKTGELVDLDLKEIC